MHFNMVNGITVVFFGGKITYGVCGVQNSKKIEFY